MKKHLYYLILTLLASGILYSCGMTMQYSDTSQIDQSVQPNTDYYEFLSDLKEGALLVRLKTSEKIINELNKHGRRVEADSLRKTQDAENRAIYQAFLKNYKFGRVYFFYDISSRDIKNRFLIGNLLDSNLKANRYLYYNGPFFVAEIGDIPMKGSDATVTGLHLLTSNLEVVRLNRNDDITTITAANYLRLHSRKPDELVQTLNDRLVAASKE